MTKPSDDLSSTTVLLVDDNPQNLKVLYETLKDKGYHLLIANDGAKALDLAGRHHPEVILLDIMMPEMDGYEVCERLKADPATSDSAVVFLSALDDLPAKVRGFAVGGADYISKPFQSEEVIARVGTHARVIRLERQMQARNRQLESDQARILNSISEGIYGLDSDGTIRFVNPAAAAIVHGQADELIGKNFFSLHFPNGESDHGLLPADATCCEGIAETRRNVQMTRLDGTRFPIEYRSSPDLDGGELRGAVVVFRDITMELAQEAALEEARAMVQDQRDQLAHFSRLTTMGEMAAGVAHEVNQPLTAITNYVRVADRLMSKESLNREMLKETLEKIESQSHRASEVIRRIRQFVKKPAAGKDVLSLCSLLEDTRAFAEVDIRNNEGGVDIECPDDLPQVVADPVQVQQVALNLIRNALEATRLAGSDAPVKVRVSAGPTHVEVEVADEGIGLASEDESKLFLPFFTTKENGMGIGLSMCRSLIQSQQGEIGYRRPESGGAAFFFTLPIAQVQPPR